MKKTRVYQLAKQFHISNKKLISIVNQLKININSHLSTLDEDNISTITKYLKKTKVSKKPIMLDWDDKELNSQFQEHVQISFQQIKNIDDLVRLMKKVNRKIYGKRSFSYGDNALQKKYLTYYAYQSNKKYTIFEIAKASGGTREIYAPSEGLKYILKTLNIIFQAIHKPQLATHGFLPNRSVVTNAKLHVNKNYVFNIDLENFFPSIHQARVWKRLQYPPFNLGGEKIELVNLIANLVCFQHEKGSKEKNFLPQGAPTSPILSNIICHRLDKKLLNLAKEYNLKYTRYADDMTFSSDHNVYQKDGDFLQKLYSVIKQENFNINERKTRLQKRGYKQEVTGIIVNEKVNVSRRYIKNIRALIHMVDKYGDEKSHNIYAKKNEDKNLYQVISGKLQYLKMVKGKDDNTYQALYKKYLDAYELKEVEVVDKKQPEETKTVIKKQKIIECEHNPKELVNILKNFSINGTAFKAAVHSDPEYYSFNGYSDFLEHLKKEWKEIDEPLKKLSKRLHGKIFAFLFSKKLGRVEKGKKRKYAWGDFKTTFGWSSLELKNWCNKQSKHPKGNSPFDYQLEEKYKNEVNGETISSFDHICRKVFKYEIEIRPDENMQQVYKIFENMQEWLGSKFCVDIDEDIQYLDGYYTDVHWLGEGIKTIFAEIKTRTKYNNIRVNLKTINESTCEIKIIHKDSEPKRKSTNLINEADNGDLATIKERFCSLCDWSIEAKCEDGDYRVNYLNSQKIEKIEKINYKPEGFTHILRFYK